MVPKEIKWSKAKHHWEIYLFVIPTIVMIALFQYYPASSGIFHSLYRWNGADISEFNFTERTEMPPKEVGQMTFLERCRDLWRNHRWGGNYRDLVATPEFWASFKVAFIIGAWNVLKMIPAVLVAVCIHRCNSARVRFFYRIMFVVPMVIPPLVIVLLWRSFFFEATNGYLNQALYGSGLIKVLSWIDANIGIGGAFKPDPTTGMIATPAWLGHPALLLTACIIWGFPWVGSFAVLTHLSKLQGIETQIYEAADIDGINWWTKFRHIEFPLMTGSIYVMLVFTIIFSIRDAGMILALAGVEGGPGGVVTVPALYMFRKAFTEQKMGYACAVGIVLMLIVMALQKITNTWMMRDFLKKRQVVLCNIGLLLAAGVLLYFKRFHLLAVIFIMLAFPKRVTVLLGTGALAYVYRNNTFYCAASIIGFVWALPWRWFATHLWPIAPLTTFWVNLRETRRARTAGRAGIQPLSIKDKVGNYLARFCKHAAIWFVLAFAFLPVYLTVIVSFKSNQQFYEKPATLTQPLHPENWRAAWEAIGPSISNSIYISTLATAAALFLALCAAYFFARLKMPLSSFFWNAILILMMMPMIANMVPLFKLLSSMNLLNTYLALILVSTSLAQISAVFVLRNFIADVPQDLFEAAEIDGASHFRQMMTVVVPLSGPILGTIGVMQFIGVWNDFMMPLIVMRDSSKLPVMVQLLRMNGEYVKFWGPMMAGYAFASIPVILLFTFTMRFFVRGVTEGALKN